MTALSVAPLVRSILALNTQKLPCSKDKDVQGNHQMATFVISVSAKDIISKIAQRYVQ